jgi:glycosyltransferase involved in cell wall biosynthesis
MIKPDFLNNVKVCMVVNQIYYTDPRVISYANALADVGAKVAVISSRQTTSYKTQKNPNIKIIPIPIARNYTSTLGYIVNYCLSIIFFVLYSSLLFLVRRYHVVHIHNMPDTLIIAALLPKLFGAKVIFDIHDPMPEFFMSKYQQGPDSKIVRFFKWQERFAARLADAVLTANPIFKERLSGRGIPQDKILVINNIPSPENFNRQAYHPEKLKSGKKFTLIYPGTIAPRYYLETLILALPRLIQDIPNIEFKMIGKHTKYVDELISLATQQGVSGHVKFIPFIPVDQIAQEITNADVGIYTALPDPHMSIAMPNKVLAYAMMGIPVISSRLPILEAFFDDSAILYFKPGNTEEFTNNVLKLHQNPALRKQLVSNADSAFTDKYPWKDEFNQYLNLMDTITK